MKSLLFLLALYVVTGWGQVNAQIRAHADGRAFQIASPEGADCDCPRVYMKSANHFVMDTEQKHLDITDSCEINNTGMFSWRGLIGGFVLAEYEPDTLSDEWMETSGGDKCACRYGMLLLIERSDWDAWYKTNRIDVVAEKRKREKLEREMREEEERIAKKKSALRDKVLEVIKRKSSPEGGKR